MTTNDGLAVSEEIREEFHGTGIPVPPIPGHWSTIEKVAFVDGFEQGWRAHEAATTSEVDDDMARELHAAIVGILNDSKTRTARELASAILEEFGIDA